jgi:flagellar hook-length control protein FliK
MDENTTQMIKERFDALPESIQELIISSNYQDIIIEIGKKYQLNVEQLGLLEQETTLVMMGLTPTKDFETELTRELKIDNTKGNQIVTEINEKIFLTIRDLLKLMYTPEGEEPSVKETPEESSRTLNLESREEMLKHIETPDLTKQKELTAPTKNEETPSILSQKLSGSFQIPKTETDHSITNLSKHTKPKIPQADPYREVPE